MLPANIPTFHLILTAAALTPVAILAAFVYCRVAHTHDATVPEFTTCIVYRVAAYILRRSNGRHRMIDLYELQPHIRADWRELTPRS